MKSRETSTSVSGSRGTQPTSMGRLLISFESAHVIFLMHIYFSFWCKAPGCDTRGTRRIVTRWQTTRNELVTHFWFHSAPHSLKLSCFLPGMTDWWWFHTVTGHLIRWQPVGSRHRVMWPLYDIQRVSGLKHNEASHNQQFLIYGETERNIKELNPDECAEERILKTI